MIHDPGTDSWTGQCCIQRPSELFVSSNQRQVSTSICVKNIVPPTTRLQGRLRITRNHVSHLERGGSLGPRHAPGEGAELEPVPGQDALEPLQRRREHREHQALRRGVLPTVGLGYRRPAVERSFQVCSREGRGRGSEPSLAATEWNSCRKLAAVSVFDDRNKQK